MAKLPDLFRAFSWAMLQFPGVGLLLNAGVSLAEAESYLKSKLTLNAYG
jgi:hypothetical protein